MSDIIQTFKVGVKGKFIVNAPFSSIVSSTTQLEVIAVSSIHALVSDGIDVLNLYYLPAGSTQAQYESDLALGVQIISLASESGIVTKVPANAISVPPVMDGVEYRNFALAASLSILPSTYDFSSLKEDLEAFIKARVGVGCRVYIPTYGDPVLYSTQDAAVLESQRLAALSVGDSLYAQLAASNALVATLQAKLAALEAYVIANHH